MHRVEEPEGGAVVVRLWPRPARIYIPGDPTVYEYEDGGEAHAQAERSALALGLGIYLIGMPEDLRVSDHHLRGHNRKYENEMDTGLCGTPIAVDDPPAEDEDVA